MIVMTGALYVELSATASIGETVFTVTGKIPRLSTNAPISFVLQIAVQGQLENVIPTDVVQILTNSGYTFTTSEIESLFR